MSGALPAGVPRVVGIGLERLPPAFLLALGLTVAALGLVVWTGASRRRRAHYASVVAMAAALAWAIREAERLGRGLLFEGAAGRVQDVHMLAVAVTFVLVPALLVTGVALARGRERARTAHRRLAVAFVVAVLITCGLGTAMTLLAAPRTPGVPEADALHDARASAVPAAVPPRPAAEAAPVR